ncbi:hypothetical protein BJX99DRAFT_253267 [Aspergillus californicus]
MSQEPVPGARVAAEVAQLFDEAKIPSILWGWLAISLVGDADGFPEVDFVIPDHYIVQAIITLAKKYPSCADGKCLSWQEDRAAQGEYSNNLRYILACNRFHYPAVTHYHAGGEVVLYLMKKSEILFWLPDYEAGPPRANDGHLTVSSCPLLPPAYPAGPTGPWSELYPIQMLNPNSLTEAVLYLLARDLPNPEYFRPHTGQVWRDMKFALADCKDTPRAVASQAYRRYLKPECRLTWDYLNGRKPEGHARNIILFLWRKHLIDTRVLPAKLTEWNYSGFSGWNEVKSFMRDDTA